MEYVIFFCFVNSLYINFFESTIFNANSVWIHYPIPEFPINPLSVSRIHFLFRGFNLNLLFLRENYKFTICFTNNLWIIYIICKFTMNPDESTIFYRKFNMNTLSISQIHYEYNICFANHFLFWKFTINTKTVAQIHYFSAIPVGIHHLFREFTIRFANFLWIHYPLRKINKNSLSVS